MKKTRFIPYGYTMRNGRAVIEHTEADVIRYIFEDYIKGSSLKEIADELTRQRVPYTEKSTEWDKARIARIIENTRYIGIDDYDPIIDTETYEQAVTAKTARQRNQTVKECEGIELLRRRVKCEKCGAPMVRRVCSKRKIKESWICTNNECGCRVLISDNDLLFKIAILMNRIIENSELILPKNKNKRADSPAVAELQSEINDELERECPSEELIISKVSDIASQLYRESQAKEMIAAGIARKRIMLMKPQDRFNCDYFSELIDYITLSDSGKVILYTKTETQISEGDNANGS